MQLYGLDNDRPILAFHAEKQKKYTCPECHGPLRVRGGPHRHLHFYHLGSSLSCRQHSKGAVHLKIQELLKEALEGSEMEKPYPTIGRIADVAWVSQKIIFEIQCSPISLKEVEERTNHYNSLGLDVIWILHDQRFNRKRIGLAERFLRDKGSCYFTNIDQHGQGMIYDQFECLHHFTRKFKGKSLPVNLRFPKKGLMEMRNGVEFPQIIKDRLQNSTLHFRGDLVDLSSNSSQEKLYPMISVEKRFFLSSEKSSFVLYFKNLYLGLVRFLIEALSH